MNVAVIGAGYVGLATAVGLATLGHSVRVGERDEARVEALRQGKSPIYEPELSSFLQDAVDGGRLVVHTSNTEVVVGAQVVFLAVPTPQGEDGSADTSIVYAVLDEIASHLSPSAIVVLKSTVPVGTVGRVQDVLRELGSDAVAISNPEFLREGSAISDFLHPDRIVIGTSDQRAAETMIELYRGLQAPLVVTDPVSSEMVKYSANAFLATRITFANAIANLCEAVGADVKDVLLGMGYDSRIGFHFFNPGPGFGGSCFPKDTNALVAVAEDAGYDFALLKSVIRINDLQLERVVGHVRRGAGGSLEGKTVGLWGLAFKAGTDDTRSSPAIAIAELLLKEGCWIRAHDPQAHVTMDGVEQVGTAMDAVRDADVLLIATEWSEYRVLDLHEVAKVMRGTAIVDARNLLDPSAVRRLGLSYQGIGR
jgi:UDPglucose 6-dehydrogenase